MSTSKPLVVGLAAVLMAASAFAQTNAAQTSKAPVSTAKQEGAASNALGASTAAAAAKQAEPTDAETPVRQVPDPGAITTNQSISPAGVQSVFESRVYGIAFGNSPSEVYVSTTARGGSLVYRLDWRSNQVLEKLEHTGSPGMQGLTYDPVAKSPVLTSNGRAGIELVRTWNSTLPPAPTVLGKSSVANVALSPASATGTRYAVVALTFNDEAAILDLATGSILNKVRTGIAPFGAAIGSDNATAWVSNWGGRFPRAGDRTAATGSNATADQIVVDARGVASSGTLSRIDLKTGVILAEIEVGLHPTSIALDDTRHRLYVTNSNSDTLSVVDTTANKLIDSISIEPFSKNVAGVAPEALVLSADGRHLYAACAGINAVAVLSLQSGKMRLDGLIPTGWYPDAIALSPDGKFIAVSTLLGVGSGWKNAPKSPGIDLSPKRRYVHSYRGTIHVIPVPDDAQLRRDSIAVAANNHLPLKRSAAIPERTVASSTSLPVPIQSGDPSPIKHIIYVIKENRSYDQFFGGLGKGNGDPALQNYSDDVIPNHRKLARDYVLLDNFYATGGNSGDGHQWVTQASETDYTYWAGDGGRSYPYGGDDPMADASGGFLWNATANAGKSFIDFGEYAGYGEDAEHPGAKPKENRQQLLEDFKAGRPFGNTFSAKASIASLEPYVAKGFPAWSLDVPDVARARVLIDYLHQWEASGDMPSLVMAQLPSDHTSGTSPGFSTPTACIADNDYAVGLLVDAVSHSKFWSSTLLLFVEDDAQAGLDHVDGHRTVALAVSPYIKRGSVDSTFYSQTSMIKTIELILGLKNMSLFDLIANDMRNSFQPAADLTPYAAVEPTYSIYTVNPPLKALTGQQKADAQASLKMNFRIPDAAPTEKLNAILWRNVRGPNAKYPKVTQAVFAPYSTDLDDDEKEERNERH